MKQALKIIPFKLWAVIALFFIGSFVEFVEVLTSESAVDIEALTFSILGVIIATGLLLRINAFRIAAVIFIAIQLFIIIFLGGGIVIMSVFLAYEEPLISPYFIFLALLFITLLLLMFWMLSYLLSDEARAIFITKPNLESQNIQGSQIEFQNRSVLRGIPDSKIGMLIVRIMNITRISVAVTLLIFMPLYFGLGLFHLSIMPNTPDSISEAFLSDNYNEDIVIVESEAINILDSLIGNESIYGILLLGLSVFFIIIPILLLSGKSRSLIASVFIVCFSLSWIGVEQYGYVYKLQFALSPIFSTLIPIMVASILMIYGVYVLYEIYEVNIREIIGRCRTYIAKIQKQ